MKHLNLPRKIPTQARSRMMVETILTSTAKVVVKHGYQGTNTNLVAQRAGDVVTRRGQLHVYQPLLANAKDGYWPAGALLESDAQTGKWQELTPTLSSSCAVFPHGNAKVQARQGDYAWALWRPYSCCQRRGQVFLGSVDFL